MSNRDHSITTPTRPWLAGVRSAAAYRDRAARATSDLRELEFVGPAGGGLDYFVRNRGSSQVFRVKGPADFRATPGATVIVAHHVGQGPETIINTGTLPEVGPLESSSRVVGFPDLYPVLLGLTPSVSEQAFPAGPVSGIAAVGRGISDEKDFAEDFIMQTVVYVSKNGSPWARQSFVEDGAGAAVSFSLESVTDPFNAIVKAWPGSGLSSGDLVRVRFALALNQLGDPNYVEYPSSSILFELRIT